MSNPVVKPPSHAGRQRRPRLIALGLLFVVLGGLGAAALYNATHESRPAVVMTTDVVRGDVIEATDLKVAEAPVGLGEFFPASDLDSLIGRTARYDLPAGAFPAPRLLGALPVPEDSAVVGLVLGPGRVPSKELVPGQGVQLVDLNDGTVVADAVVVTAPQLLEDHSTKVLDIAVSRDRAARVASLSAQEQVALYTVEGG
ncbi:MAG: SAF domain-containing protein [Arachnia propionica]|uniref:SAF domain-containing protein n=1 Tax=Arachnia propionica TaxID=1750 RepID=UPI002710A3CB|nr:SAF domain-containing protein [Arachnia propionica]